ncbi:hypothetical protein GO730_24930 [Spirosoma sp. HMF3257]|uniref:Uncharacterized protein n=1 Tax=Spirosoma telluris TaxID=2183553 RepID=A0A327NPB8_9BACT|nr:hypothetical protein [Spirosoma telluris]RAI76585.1 hypothetical protein HMF3257_24870 [Spirosoma telluris]
MKKFLLLLVLGPLQVWAQQDRIIPPPISAENLKPIESDLVPSYNGRYGQRVRTQYIYDGLDVRHAKDLGPYIMASGNPDAIREFNSYIASRHTGGWLIAGGITSAIVGAIIMGSNGSGNNGKFTTQQPFYCPVGNVCGGTSGTVYGGQIAGYQTVVDTHKQNTYAAGGITLIGGAILAGIGFGMNIPGSHVRRAVQYYNRALKQQGISWQLTPYSSLSSSGVGLVGKF